MARTSAAPAQTHSLGYNLGALVLGIALLGLGLAYGVDATGRSPQRGATSGAGELSVQLSVGGRDLEIPSSWFRGATPPTSGFAKQVDLSLTLPLGAGGTAREIDVTLLPRSQVRPSASLLDGVYLHQFMPEQLSGPVGLVGKPLIADEGYEGETVWYDALSANPFVAKCSAPVAEGVQGRCMRSVYLGPGVAAVYGFDREVLEQWREFDAQVQGRLERTGVL